MTTESQQIAAEVDKFPEAERARMRDAIMQIAATYAATRKSCAVAAPKPKKRFRRRARRAQPCEVISLADWRTRFDRSAS